MLQKQHFAALQIFHYLFLLTFACIQAKSSGGIFAMRQSAVFAYILAKSSSLPHDDFGKLLFFAYIQAKSSSLPKSLFAFSVWWHFDFRN